MVLAAPGEAAAAAAAGGAERARLARPAREAARRRLAELERIKARLQQSLGLAGQAGPEVEASPLSASPLLWPAPASSASSSSSAASASSSGGGGGGASPPLFSPRRPCRLLQPRRARRDQAEAAGRVLCVARGRGREGASLLAVCTSQRLTLWRGAAGGAGRSPLLATLPLPCPAPDGACFAAGDELLLRRRRRRSEPRSAWTAWRLRDAAPEAAAAAASLQAVDMAGLLGRRHSAGVAGADPSSTPAKPPQDRVLPLRAQCAREARVVVAGDRLTARRGRQDRTSRTRSRPLPGRRRLRGHASSRTGALPLLWSAMMCATPVRRPCRRQDSERGSTSAC